jgi:hypothetical protein
VDAPGCVLKSLPPEQWIEAGEQAAQINPVNRPEVSFQASLGLELEPAQIALLTTKYWGWRFRELATSFLDGPSPELKRRILAHLNAWDCGIRFVESGGRGTVRISRGQGGYWSYLGTDVLLIPGDRPTMNLQGFMMSTPEAEFKRVVRHEAGHTLGFPHEHMRKDVIERLHPEKVYNYFLKVYGWGKRDVDQQVLTPLSERNLYATPPDETSVMCYQLPGSITRDGRPVAGGEDINGADRAFAQSIYPTFSWGQDEPNEKVG